MSVWAGRGHAKRCLPINRDSGTVPETTSDGWTDDGGGGGGGVD